MRAAARRILLRLLPRRLAPPPTFTTGAGLLAPVVLVAVRGNTSRGAVTFAAALRILMPLMPRRPREGIPPLKTQ